MEKQIKLFLEFLQNDKKLSDNTLQSYKRDISQFEKYIEESLTQYELAEEMMNETYIDCANYFGIDDIDTLRYFIEKNTIPTQESTKKGIKNDFVTDLKTGANAVAQKISDSAQNIGSNVEEKITEAGTKFEDQGWKIVYGTENLGKPYDEQKAEEGLKNKKEKDEDKTKQ